MRCPSCDKRKNVLFGKGLNYVCLPCLRTSQKEIDAETRKRTTALINKKIKQSH
jgi:hypothetical protein